MTATTLPLLRMFRRLQKLFGSIGVSKHPFTMYLTFLSMKMLQKSIKTMLQTISLSFAILPYVLCLSWMSAKRMSAQGENEKCAAEILNFFCSLLIKFCPLTLLRNTFVTHAVAMRQRPHLLHSQSVEQHQTLRLRLALLDQHGVIAFHIR